MASPVLGKNLLGRRVSTAGNREFRNRLRKQYPYSREMPKPDKGIPCFHCGRDDFVFPAIDIICCPLCMSRLFPSTTLKITDDIYLDNNAPHCNWCQKRSIRMYKVSGRMCQKCTILVAENVREHKHGVPRRFRHL